MDGFCDFCEKPFEEGDKVTALITDTWNGECMASGWDREEIMVHDDVCLAKISQY